MGAKLKNIFFIFRSESSEFLKFPHQNFRFFSDRFIFLKYYVRLQNTYGIIYSYRLLAVQYSYHTRRLIVHTTHTDCDTIQYVCCAVILIPVQNIYFIVPNTHPMYQVFIQSHILHEIKTVLINFTTVIISPTHLYPCTPLSTRDLINTNYTVLILSVLDIPKDSTPPKPLQPI